MRRLAAAIVLAGSLTLGACEDVVDPDGVPGTFELIEANGEPLPAVVFDGELQGFGHVVATVVSGSITLRQSDYTERIVSDLVVNGDPFLAPPLVVSGNYSIEGQLLSFEPTSHATYPDFTGTLEGDVLTTVEIDPQFGQTVFTWER